MKSRFFGSAAFAATITLAIISFPLTASADGPDYTFLGASYEWTDSKFAVDPSDDPGFNDGSIEGVNIDASLGILSWLHIAGQYFDGDCADCNPSTGGDFDYKGYEVGLGYNQSLGFIGSAWQDTDFVLRVNYLDVELENDDEDGWSVQGEIRTRISERATFNIGYEYQQIDQKNIDDVENRNLTIGLDYRIWDGLALTADGMIFDDDTGFALGARWYFGNLLFGDRDSIVR